jgi:tape measure domain-containing protein
VSDELRLKVDTRDLERADGALARVEQGAEDAARAAGRFTDAAGRMREANGRFVAGAQRTTDALEQMRQRAAGTANALRSLQARVASLFTAAAAINLADAYTTLDARLRLVTKSEQERAATLRALNGVADRTRTQVTDTAELYVKLRQANEGLGYSTARTADLTEAFGLALKVSGASGAAASAAITQFAQAMSKGAATGDEFVTIAETAPEVLRIVQQELGVSRAKLLEMREAGELTAKVIGDALVKNLERLRGQVGEAPKTISDGFTALRNSMVRVVGGSQDLQRAARNVAEGLERIGRFLEDNGPMLVQLGKVALAFTVAAKAAKALQGAVVALNGASLASLVGRLGPLVAVLAPFTGVVAKGMRDASDLQARNAEVERLRSLPRGQLDAFAGALVTERSAIERRRYVISQLTGAERVAAQAEDLALNRRLNAVRARQLLVRDAGGYGGVTGLSDEGGFTPAPASEETKKKKVPKARDFDLVGAREAYRRKLRDFDEDIARDAERDNERVRDAFTRRTEALAQAAADRAKAITQAITDGLQRTFADGVTALFERGARSMRDFFEVLRSTALRTFAQIVGSVITRRLLELLTRIGAATQGGGRVDGVDGGRAGGAGGVLGFAGGALRLAAGGMGGGRMPVLSFGGAGGIGGAGGASGSGIGSTLPVLLGRRIPGVGITGMQAAGGVGIGLLGYGLGSAIGRSNGRGLGIAGGIGAGAATGAAIGSIIPVIGTAIGAIIGGVAGAIGGIIGGNRRRRAQREAARQRGELSLDFLGDLGARNAAASGSTALAEQLRLEVQQRQELRQAIQTFGANSVEIQRLRDTQARELALLTNGALSPGVYLGGSGIDVTRARFEAGRPVTITGPITIAVPEGTTTEQATRLL